MGFTRKRGFHSSTTRRVFSSSAAAGYSLSLCWQLQLMQLGWSSQMSSGPSQFTDAAPKLPHEAAHDAGQAITETHGQAAGPRTMETSFLPLLLPTRGPSVPFTEPQFLFMLNWDNKNDPKPQRHWGGGLGRAPRSVLHHGVCAGALKPGGTWLSHRGRAMVPPCCSGLVASSLPSGTLAKGPMLGMLLWHHRPMPTYALVVGPAVTPCFSLAGKGDFRCEFPPLRTPIHHGSTTLSRVTLVHRWRKVLLSKKTLMSSAGP